MDESDFLENIGKWVKDRLNKTEGILALFLVIIYGSKSFINYSIDIFLAIIIIVLALLYAITAFAYKSTEDNVATLDSIRKIGFFSLGVTLLGISFRILNLHGSFQMIILGSLTILAVLCSVLYFKIQKTINDLPDKRMLLRLAIVLVVCGYLILPVLL